MSPEASEQASYKRRRKSWEQGNGKAEARKLTQEEGGKPDSKEATKLCSQKPRRPARIRSLVPVKELGGLGGDGKEGRVVVVGGVRGS